MESSSNSDQASDIGGDSACWLSQLCPHCGAMIEDADGQCWRCGARPGDEAPAD
ncbi:hypothetical protein [Microbacterium sp. YY-01]|uniref:hypothetical protein n=1 Tax=Microbacterium sp. YY-01 TaxID=3421634 RepID=UPI003D177AE5